MLRSVSTELTSSPRDCMPPRPSTKDDTAPAASFCHAVRNSAAVMPAVCAIRSSESPPWRVALSICLNVLLMAVPPASASMPTDDNADAKPSTSCSDMPTELPAAAIRWAIDTMSRSVEAPALPSATMVEPRLSTSSCEVPITFMSCASDVAASSADRFVVSPRSIMTRVNAATSSMPTPSWPAASATAAIS